MAYKPSAEAIERRQTVEALYADLERLVELRRRAIEFARDKTVEINRLRRHAGRLSVGAAHRGRPRLPFDSSSASGSGGAE